jgi:opacity protein-like surface antigen
MLRGLVLAVLLLAETAAAQQVDPHRNHRTRWWLSAIASLGAASVYSGATRQLDAQQMPPPGGVGRGAGIIVTRQLGINFGITGALLCGEWFLLKYQGRKHSKLEPIFMIVNYGGAMTLSTAAAVELSGKKQKP